MYTTHMNDRCDNNFASKGGAYGVGIPALVTGGLALLNQMGGGGLGGILGGGNGQAAAQAVIAQKDAEIATLKAERYSDNAAKEESNRLLQNYLKPYGDAIAVGQIENAKLAARIDCLEKTQALEKELCHKEIQLAKQEAQCCCTQNANAIAAISATLNGLITVGIPNAKVIPAPTTTTTATAA